MDLSKKKKMIKNMNNKMTTNSQLSTTEPEKTKQSQKRTKQLKQEQNHRNGDRSHGGLSVGRGRGENGGKGTGNK